MTLLNSKKKIIFLDHENFAFSDISYMLNILSWWTHFVSWPAWMSQLRTCPNQVLRNESSPESRPDVYHESWVKSWEEIQI